MGLAVSVKKGTDATAENTKASPRSMVASQPARGSPMRPEEEQDHRPSQGRSGTTQIHSANVQAHSWRPREAIASAPQLVELVHRCGGTAEDGDDDGQADHHLCGGHHQHEEHSWPLRIAQRPAPRDECRATALSISSIDMNMMIALRRSRRPAADQERGPPRTSCTNRR